MSIMAIIWLALGVFGALIGLIAVLFVVVMLLGGHNRGGWKRIASHYPLTHTMGPIQVWPKQTIQLGQVRFRGCVQIGILGEGLYLDTTLPRLSPMLIPWGALADPIPKKLYGQAGWAFSLRELTETQLVVYDALGSQIATHVPQSRRS